MLRFISNGSIAKKRVLLRVDFNVTLNPDSTIADDIRIRQSLPTIKHLLKHKNSIIILSHLGRPKGRDPKLSLKPVVERLREYIKEAEISLVEHIADLPEEHKESQITVLENIRYWPEEKENNPDFSKRLAGIADAYVNDAFGVSHRESASVVGIAKLLPSYAGILLKKEIKMIEKSVKHAKKPVVAIIGGAKISTKIAVLARLVEVADYLLIGGGLANTFFKAEGKNIGKSLLEEGECKHAQKLLFLAAKKNTALLLPDDVMLGTISNHQNGGEEIKVDNIERGEKRAILDIGSETQAKFGSVIAKAKTIIWNGPVGYNEHPAFRRGTDFIYYSIAQNQKAISVVGGGDTLATISKKEYLESITHISTGGGAMLEFIEKGTLPGIQVLDR